MRASSSVSRGVALPALAIILGVTACCGFFPEQSARALSGIQQYILTNLGWSYVLLFAVYIVFLVVLAVGKTGNIRLGSDYTRPMYGYFTWSAMLFATGMGIGLMFFGVAEPMSHYVNPPLPGLEVNERAKFAQIYTFLHWGIHGWSVYGLVALALAYFRYRYKLPLAIRSAFYPLLKERLYGRWGDLIDIFALCSTVFGIATTLGYGVLQVNAGLMSTGLVSEVGFSLQAIITCVLIGIALLSAISGLDRGVKFLSQANMLLGLVLLAFIVIVGPTRHIIGTFSEGLGFYLNMLPEMVFNTYAYEPPGQEWFVNWTVFYWAWWIAWAPFVGLFIARISKGRTIREFIVGVVLVPSLCIFFWMTAFGNSAIWLDQHEAAGALSVLADKQELLLFSFFEYLPFTETLKILAVGMIVVFFVTSADSGIMVISSIASGNARTQPRSHTVFWGALLLVLALSLLRSGGLGAIQTLTLIAALPFGVILVLLCACLWQALRTDALFHSSELPHGSLAWRGERWQQRLRTLLSFGQLGDIREFLNGTVAEAFTELRDEMQKMGIEAAICEGASGKGDSIELLIPHRGLRNFVYGVFAERKNISRRYADQDAIADLDEGDVYVPLTYFNDGREGYDIRHLSREEIIADVLREYGRFLDAITNEETEIMMMETDKPFR